MNREAYPLPPAIEQDGTFPGWRLIIERRASFLDVEAMSLCEIVDGCDMLDLLAAEINRPPPPPPETDEKARAALKGGRR